MEETFYMPIGTGKSTSAMEAAVKMMGEELEKHQNGVSSSTSSPRLAECFNVLGENECLNLCTSKKCNADCCGCVNILEVYFKRLKHLIPAGKEYALMTVKENGDRYVKPVTSNMKCVFLTDENTCSIYGHHLRPDYCKRYGEDKVEPLYACVKVNEDCRKELEEAAKLFLKQQINAGNTIAGRILETYNDDTEDKNLKEDSE